MRKEMLIFEIKQHKNEKELIITCCRGTRIMGVEHLGKGQDILEALDKLRRRSKIPFVEFTRSYLRYSGNSQTMTQRIATTFNQALFFLRDHYTRNRQIANRTGQRREKATQ